MHTKEPWVEQEGILRVGKPPLSGSWRDPIKLASAWREDAWCDGDATEETRANAARIVSCVNAMAGIPDPAAYVAAFEAMVEALNRIERRTKALPDDTAEDNKRDKFHAHLIARTALQAARIARGDA